MKKAPAKAKKMPMNIAKAVKMGAQPAKPMKGGKKAC